MDPELPEAFRDGGFDLSEESCEDGGTHFNYRCCVD